MPSLELTARDRRILDHVRRYRITTNEVLLRDFVPSADALKTVLKRLVGPCLQSRPLGLRRRVYYQLTNAAAKQLGEPVEVARPLGLQALSRAYAVLAFCRLANTTRERLDRHELRADFPELVEANLTKQADYYIDEWQEKACLARIVIDQGTEHTALIRKCRRIIRDCSKKVSGFAQAADADEFAFAIITAERTKQNAIRDALARSPLGVPVRLHTVPELTELLQQRGRHARSH